MPDGTILEFPEGTPPETMRKASDDYWKKQRSSADHYNVEQFKEATRKAAEAGDTATARKLIARAKAAEAPTEEQKRLGQLKRRQVAALKGKRDYDQIMKALRRAHEAGDTAAARRLAQMAKEAKQVSPTISMKDIRDQYPQYSDLSDQQVLEGLHRKFYSDMDFADFSSRIEGANIGGQGDKSLGTRLWENIVGDDDPTTQNTGEKIGSFLNKAGESLTFGLVGDEASAAAESLLPGVDYETRRDHYRDQERQFTKEHPVAAVGAELAPLAIPGVGTMGLVGKGVGLGAKMARGTAVAGTQGTTYGFMEGEGSAEERAQQAKDAGTMSAILGMAAPVAGKGVERYLNNRATRKAVNQMVKDAPSADDLTAQASRSYNQGKARGQIVSPKTAQSLAADVTDTLKREGVMRADGSLITRDPDARRVLDELQDLGKFGLSGNQVKPVREVFQSAAQDRNPARARLGKILLDKFDEMVGREAPEFRQGDKLYSRAKKVEAVDQMTDIADTSDTTNALRREFQKADRRQIKGQRGGMTDDEIAAMQRVARGGRFENAARAAGRSAPTSFGSAMFTGGMPFSAGAMAGSPTVGAAIGTAAVGMGTAGRAVSNSIQKRNAEIARALIASGGKMPRAEASSTAVEQIVRALMAGAPRGGAILATP